MKICFSLSDFVDRDFQDLRNNANFEFCVVNKIKKKETSIALGPKCLKYSEAMLAIYKSVVSHLGL